MAVQMTRAEYEAKYGSPAPAPSSAPVKMTRAEYDAKYAQTTPANTPLGALQRAGNAIKDQFQSSAAQANQAAEETRAATNPITKFEGLLKFGAGVAGVISAPAAPIFAPVSALVQRAGQGYANTIPGIQQFATSKAGQVTSRVAEDVANAGTIAGTLAGARGGVKAAETTGERLTSRTAPKETTVPQERLVSKRNAELTKIESTNAPVRRVIEKAKGQGIDVKADLAKLDVPLTTDAEGTLHTREAMQELNTFLEPIERVVSDNLKREGAAIPLKDVQTRLTRAIDNSGLEADALESAYSKLDATMKGLSRRADENGRIPLAKVHDAKVSKYSTIDYMNEGAKIADKAIARELKQLVEDHTRSADVKGLNGELSRYFSVLDLLEKLDGKKVKGGRLGKYFAQTLGGIAGSHLGPFGTIAGAEIARRLQGAALERTFPGRPGGGLQPSEAMIKAAQAAKQPRLGLPAPREGAPRTQTNGYEVIPLKGKAQPSITDQNSFKSATSPDTTTANTSAPRPITSMAKPADNKVSIPDTVSQSSKPATSLSTTFEKAKALFKKIKTEGQRGFVKNPLGGGKKLPDPQKLAAKMDAEDLKIVRSYIDVIDGKSTSVEAFIDASARIDTLLERMGVKPTSFKSEQEKIEFVAALRDHAEADINDAATGPLGKPLHDARGRFNGKRSTK